jgi:hypothetical protein
MVVFSQSTHLKKSTLDLLDPYHLLVHAKEPISEILVEKAKTRFAIGSLLIAK